MSELTFSAWLISIISALFIGMAKTGINGLGTIIVPIMALQFGGMYSTGLVLPLLIMADVFAVIYYHRHAHFRTLVAIMPWALVGIGVGLWIGKLVSPTQFRQLIGIVLLFGLLVMLLKKFLWETDLFSTKNKFLASVFGLFGGFSTMIGNAAGPVMSVYLLLKNLPKNEFIGTAAWFFLIVNVIKLPLQIWVWDNITLETLYFDFKLLPFIALGAWLGIKLVKLVSERVYRWFIILGTIASSIALFI